MSKMVTLLSTLPESVVSLMSDEAKEVALSTLIPALVPAKVKKSTPRAMSVAALSVYGTAKERKEDLADKVGSGVYVVKGATKDEVAKAFDGFVSRGESLDVATIDKTEVVAGIAYKKGEKVVVVTNYATTGLFLDQISRVKTAQETFGRRSSEARAEIRTLQSMEREAA